MTKNAQKGVNIAFSISYIFNGVKFIALIGS